ncbi:MAG TPA: biotin-dependent carboxyltransferase family protein [Gemmataceae bacterium]|nr:biotin-dependent carboxyltransferase family protein [Gemmataceae bacterium]
MTTAAVLKVLQPGLCTLVVDNGRPRSRSLGVPIGGAADRTALAIGNALVGNAPGGAALEVALAGPTLVADAELACVLYGAPFDLSTERRPLTVGKTFTLAPGEVLRIGGAPQGARAYLCIRGGLQTSVVLGSRSSLTPLQAGAEISCLSAIIQAHFVRFEEERSAAIVLRVLDGAQADWFPGKGFYGGDYSVAPSSNRMGVRLAGPSLHPLERQMISEPVCPGSVQMTRDGQCIILGMDGQTIGGYPKIAQVISADLDAVGQLRPGDRLKFRRITLDEAERLFREKQAQLRDWLARLRSATIADAPRES